MSGAGPAPPEAVDLSIIIVSYNTRAMTVAALASLARFPPSIPYEVVLLDNASHDGSAEAVAAAHPDVKLIAHPTNTGFAGGNNLAVPYASGKRLLLLNPDTEVFAGSLDALWAFAERAPARGIWGGRTLFADGSLNPTSCWSRITLWSLFCSAVGLTWAFPRSPLFHSEAFGGWQRDTERDVDIVTGCFFLIDRSLWDTLGGFDPQFFMYAEEADLCLRAARLGARPAVTPDAVIVHHGGASETSAVDKVVKTLRGRMTLIRKHWSPPAAALAGVIYRGYALSRLLGSRFLTGPRDTAATSAPKWAQIWSRRNEWLAGY
jgi:GT2 family glycosyltransferase